MHSHWNVGIQLPCLVSAFGPLRFPVQFIMSFQIENISQYVVDLPITHLMFIWFSFFLCW